MLLFCFLLLHNLFAIVDDYSLEAGADTLTCQVVVAVVSLGVRSQNGLDACSNALDGERIRQVGGSIGWYETAAERLVGRVGALLKLRTVGIEHIGLLIGGFRRDANKLEVEGCGCIGVITPDFLVSTREGILLGSIHLQQTGLTQRVIISSYTSFN